MFLGLYRRAIEHLAREFVHQRVAPAHGERDDGLNVHRKPTERIVAEKIGFGRGQRAALRRFAEFYRRAVRSVPVRVRSRNRWKTHHIDLLRKFPLAAEASTSPLPNSPYMSTYITAGVSRGVFDARIC